MKGAEVEAEILRAGCFDARLFGPGVYHLLQGGRVVYIGCSSCLALRIAQWHASVGKPSCAVQAFDSVAVIFAADMSEAWQIERAHLEQHRPLHNRAGVTRAYCPPGPLPPRQGPSRAELLHGVEGVVGVQFLRSNDIPPGAKKPQPRADLLELLAIAGFPEPDGFAKDHPKWEAETVAAWIQERGPFGDES